jgi:hypothetical protein
MSSEGGNLSVDALAVGRYPCIAENHGCILRLSFAREKPFVINGQISVKMS